MASTVEGLNVVRRSNAGYKPLPCNSLYQSNGGGRGIRTPGTVTGSVVFKTTAIDHSAIPPHRKQA
jgi:hypothetical protein